MPVNDQLGQRIQENASKIMQDSVAKNNAANYLDGAARVARGESLQEIKQSAPFVERLFGGGATQAGAEEMYLKQSTSQYIADSAANMDKLREQDPEQWAAGQIKVFSDAATGNKSLDDRLMVAGKGAIGAVAKIQQKAHLIWQQEQSVTGYNALVQTHLDEYNAVKNAGAQNHDIAASADRLQVALKRTGGHDEQAHKNQLVAFASAGLERGDSTITDMMQGMDLNLDVDDYRLLDKAKGQYFVALRKEHALDISSASAEIADIANGVDPNTDLMVKMIQDIQDTYGTEAVPVGRAMGWLTKAVTAKSTKMNATMAGTKYLNDGGGNDFDSKKNAVMGMIEATAMVQARVDDPLNPMTQEQADKTTTDAWARTDDSIFDPKQQRRWNTNANMPLDSDGNVTDGFVQVVEKTRKFLAADYDKVASMFDDPVAFQRLLSVQGAIDDGMSIESATRLFQDKAQVARGIELFDDPVFRKAASAQIEEVLTGGIPVPGRFFDVASSNRPLVREMLMTNMREIAMSSNNTDKLVEAAAAKLTNEVELLNGEFVHKQGGKSFGELAGMSQEEGNNILDYFLENSVYFRLEDRATISTRIQGDRIVFLKEDDFGTPVVSDNPNYGLGFKVTDVAAAYKKTKVEEQIEFVNDNSQNAEAKIQEMMLMLSRDTVWTSMYSPDELRTEAIKELEQESDIRIIGRKVAEGIMTGFQSLQDQQNLKSETYGQTIL